MSNLEADSKFLKKAVLPCLSRDEAGDIGAMAAKRGQRYLILGD